VVESGLRPHSWLRKLDGRSSPHVGGLANQSRLFFTRLTRMAWLHRLDGVFGRGRSGGQVAISNAATASEASSATTTAMPLRI
jgi:hypothetical protein